MSTKGNRGSSLATYAAVIGLVALGVSVAVSQTGEQVSGLTARVAGSVNAVDGAISGNKGPSYQGPSLGDQTVDEFDPVAQINARGFLDPEGDALSYSLSLSGGLQPDDFTVQQFPDGVVVDGTPGASGGIAVIATDPIGRKAVAGPMQITLDPNRAPVFTQWAPDHLGTVYANREIGTIALGEVTDPDPDSIQPAVITDAGSGQAANFSVTGTSPATLTGTPDAHGPIALTVTWSDAHGEPVSVGPFTLDVQVDDSSCQTILETGGSTGNGVYTIDPDGDDVGFEAYCDMETDGGGWTLIASSYVNAAGSTSAPFNVTHNTAVNSGVGSPGLGGNYFMPIRDYAQLATPADPVDYRWYAKAGGPGDPWQLTQRYGNHALDAADDYRFQGTGLYHLSNPTHYVGKRLSAYDVDLDEYPGINCAAIYRTFGWYTACHNAHFWSDTNNSYSYGGTAVTDGYSNLGPDAAGSYNTWYHLKIMVR